MFRGWILIPLLALAAAAQPASSAPSAKFRISGTVVDSVRGDVLPDIEVSIGVSQSEALLQTVLTGPDGRFEFAGLAPAKYSLTARGRGYRQQGYEEHQFYFTGIVTGPGLDSENLVFRLKAEAAISGTVTDEFNEPVPIAEVDLMAAGLPDAPQAVLLRFNATTDDTGHFHIGHLQEGKYYLAIVGRPWYARDTPDDDERRLDTANGPVVTSDGSPRAGGGAASGPPRHSPLDVTFQTAYYPDATDPGQATPIVLKPGERATADLHLFAVPAVHLKIRGSAAFASSPAMIKLSEQVFGYSRVVTQQGVGAEGAELSGLAPGHYTLEFRPPSGMPQQQPLDLVADMDIGLGDGGKLVSTVTATVQLEGEKGTCQRCFFRLINIHSREAFDARNTPQGFEIDGGVRPGSYAISLPGADGYEIKYLSAVGAKVVGKQIEIRPGAAVSLNIVLTKHLATINGIALRDNKPVSQTAVLLVPNDPEHNLALFRRDQSDSDGTFSLLHVLPGEYTVIAIAEGWDLEWTNSAVLKDFLAGGTKIQVQPDGKYQVKVGVQAKLP